MKALNPIDIDPKNPMVEKPFFKWLIDNSSDYFINDLISYLDIDKGKDFLNKEDLQVFKNTNEYFYYLKYGTRMKSVCVLCESPELSVLTQDSSIKKCVCNNCNFEFFTKMNY